MKMNSAQIEQTLAQFEAEAIPVDHPMMVQLTRMFGDHTYFLDDSGLNIVEPVHDGESDGALGMVVNVATWIDPAAASLQPHAPEATERRVSFEPRSTH
jgi:hypothetical protein